VDGAIADEAAIDSSAVNDEQVALDLASGSTDLPQESQSSSDRLELTSRVIGDSRTSDVAAVSTQAAAEISIDALLSAAARGGG